MTTPNTVANTLVEEGCSSQKAQSLHKVQVCEPVRSSSAVMLWSTAARDRTEQNEGSDCVVLATQIRSCSSWPLHIGPQLTQSTGKSRNFRGHGSSVMETKRGTAMQCSRRTCSIAEPDRDISLVEEWATASHCTYRQTGRAVQSRT